MGILGVDDLSGDAPLMEAGLDSLCLGRYAGCGGALVCFAAKTGGMKIEDNQIIVQKRHSKAKWIFLH